VPGQDMSSGLVTLGQASDIGLRRSRNEDALLAREDLGLWLVADGMGGPGGGDLASGIAVAEVTAAVEAGLALRDAAQRAHEAILAAARAGSGRPGMGTTLVAVESRGAGFALCWVGDSRAYLWDGALVRLSHDHSYVQSLIDDGEISEAEARVHPERNVISRVLGGAMVGDCGAELLEGELAPGAQLLLCTDGLTGELEDAEIAGILGEAPPGQPAVERLVRAALEAGGSDNVTLLLIGRAEPG